eukprot:scaffold1999_cov153-Amphora_coffeaeformis.AAC.13
MCSFRLATPFHFSGEKAIRTSSSHASNRRRVWYQGIVTKKGIAISHRRSKVTVLLSERKGRRGIVQGNKSIMEEPSTPSSDMWWKLMGDDANTPRAHKTPMTPKSFRSLWANPSAIREEPSRGAREDGEQTKQTSSASKICAKESEKQRRRSTGERKPSPSNLKYNDSIDESPSGSPRSFTPVDRITVTHQDRGLPTSPLSEHSKRRKLRADDAFIDRSSYMGSADKFLDAIEDRICTLEIKSPSIADIEKRIEASWKDIESKTSEFFKCRKGCKDSEEIDSEINNPEIEEKKPLRRFAVPHLGCHKGDTGDDGKNSPKGGILKLSASEDSRDEDSCDDDDAGSCAVDDDVESKNRDVFDLNSYTMTFMEDFKERSGALDTDSVSQTVPLSDSMDFDASTMTTIQTQSMTTSDPPSLATPSLASPPPPQKPNRKASVTSADKKGLAIFEPTNSLALLVKQNAVGIAPPPPVRSSTDGKSAKDIYSHMHDLDPEFKRSCFSPKFRKKDAPLVIANTASTTSSVQTEHSKRPIDLKGEGSVIPDHSHHAYIAYFVRGPKARNVTRLYEHPTPSAFPAMNHEIVVRISYSTVSHTDCAVRNGCYWGDDSLRPLNLPIIPGVSFSGYVTQLNRASMRAGLRYGDRVISLVRVGANARHLCIARDRVVTVPDELTDDKKIACLPEIYLGAFQVLHMGQRNGSRYKKSSLADKSVLILGGTTILGKALIELCHAAGAYSVYATGKEHHFSRIEATKATPLNRDPRHWYSLLKGRIDLIIGLDKDSFGHSEASAQHLEVLSSKGRAILFGAPERTCDATLSDRKKIFVYNVFDSWEKDVKQGKRDLTHLCKLLVDGVIDPRVLESIPLCQVAQAQDAVEHRDCNSFLLCDPWMQTKRKPTKVLQHSPVYSETSDAQTVASLSRAARNEKGRRSVINGTSSKPVTAGVRERLLSL